MKNKSASQSAFFNLRVLIGLFIVMAGVFLALAGFGTFSGITASSAQAQQTHRIINVQGLPPGFDCSKIHELGIDRQENFRAGAIMIACGEGEGRSMAASLFASVNQTIEKALAPLSYGGTDVDVITGPETFPHVTQSETYTTTNPDNPNQVVVNYNDSRTASGNYSGLSFSSDGGNTFTRLNPSPFATGHGTNYGDPVVLYDRRSAAWYGIDIATGCGGFGLGSWKSTDGGQTWAVAACVHNGGNDDRESGWSDMNPSSPFYGNMYVSLNNFNVGGGALQVVRSTDNGATWSSAVTVNGSFVRDVQITGDLVTGDVYIASMNEGGGGTNPRRNLFYRSTDGGATWTNTYTGPTFSGPGSGLCSGNSYFSSMFGGYWRHMGWGEPAAINHVVHYVYAQHGSGSDAGDVYYIRSTDSGATFSAPLKLNTDTTTTPQWQPNLSVSPTGSLFAVWYDGREGTGCSPGVNTPCYRMWGRKSLDNGVTWQPDMAFSDVVSPLPAQPDGTVQGCYAGDYDYASAILTKHVSSWVDGRVLISGSSQQDVFTDREAISSGCTPGWSAGGDLPSVGVRLVGVFFPANGKFYAMGGRSSDSAGSDFTHPFEYDTVANTWTTKAATYPDNQVNNMACGVLTNAGTPYIYCVGGSAAGQTTATARAFFYNPVTDTITTLTAGDNWPGDAAGTILPGGFAVTGNKLYILGGFNINVASTNQIWQFDPTAGVGSKWLQEVNTPEGIMYAPTCAISEIIYVGGASDFQGGTVIDTTNSFSFNPATNTIGAIAPIPRATGETRALNVNGDMLVMGGGRVAPNPSNEVDIYDPSTNTWTTGSPVPAFMTARRNFPTDTNGFTNIWLAGGYATDNVTPLSSTEIFCQGAAPMAQSAFSRKVHGGAGTFDIPLPLTGSVGIECRIGPTYQMIINFANSVTVESASVTSGTGMVSSFTGSGTSQITVNLSGVTDQQRITMTLHNVSGTAMGDVPISMGVLIGDTNANGAVNAADVAQTKSQVGQPVGGSNFREDVNVNGLINSVDVALVKSDIGHALPP